MQRKLVSRVRNTVFVKKAIMCCYAIFPVFFWYPVVFLRFFVCANVQNLFLVYADPVMIITIIYGYNHQREELDIGVKPQTLS